ncbi:MAG: polysaccharide deacetylase family protein, partial [Chitinophagales bacterium]
MKWYSTPGILQKAFPSVLWRVPSESNDLFLTFDDGPTPEVTTWVLDLLKKHNAKATFFCLGKNVERYPQIFERILAEGHSIGNHSYDHPRGKDCDNKIYFENIEKAADLVKSKLFRPPYGSLK